MLPLSPFAKTLAVGTSLAVAAGGLLALSVPAGAANVSTAFLYTGAEQTYVVPDSVTKVRIAATGAQGESGAPPGAEGGKGGTVTGTFTVSPGQTLQVRVGGMGASSLGGFNGGGDGTFAFSAGGGASDVRTGPELTDRLIVAGGGGGGTNYGDPYPSGGAGGHPSGLAGEDFNAPGQGGGGGSQTAGGTAGTFEPNSSPGELGQGGAGGPGGASGGGGGYYGGGGGSAGGGGSSYYDPAATEVTTSNGTQTGHGEITITALDTTVAGTATAKKKQKVKKIKVKVVAGEELTARVSGKIKARKSYKLKSQTRTLGTGQTKVIKLKPKKSKDAKKIRKAKVTVKLTDAAGNSKRSKLKVKLRR